MRLVLTLGASVFSFTPLGGDGPYPYLTGVGTFHLAARAGASGDGETETPIASATLLNEGKRVALLIGNPLRAKADLYDHDDALAFSGTVSAIVYGREIELTFES